MAHIPMTEVNGRGTVPVDILIRHYHRVEVLVEDTLQGEVDTTWELGIKGKRCLPRLRHTEILAEDSGTDRNGRRAGSTNLLQHALLTHREGRNLLAVGCRRHIGGLSHT